MSDNKFSAEDIATYIKNNGNRCPNTHCRSDKIDVDDDFREYDGKDSPFVEREMFCRDCKGNWTEVFELTTIKK